MAFTAAPFQRDGRSYVGLLCAGLGDVADFRRPLRPVWLRALAVRHHEQQPRLVASLRIVGVLPDGEAWALGMKWDSCGGQVRYRQELDLADARATATSARRAGDEDGVLQVRPALALQAEGASTADSLRAMPDLGPAWSGRLRAVFGVPLGRVGAEHIEALVPARVTEEADLDFKESLYGNSAGERHELCKDIAAMRNHRGGVIVLGVRDEGGVATACPGVALSDDESRRMRQIVAAGTAPHAEFEIRPAPGRTGDIGFYLLVAEPSPFRPHAVVVNEGLRYPRRDGTTTRWLSEVEVADLYRDRFRGQSDQLDRLMRIGREARDRLGQDGTWMVAAAVPNHAGALEISFAGQRAIEEWARAEYTSSDFIDGFFEPPAVVMAGVGVERYTFSTHFDQGQRATYMYAECHTDGAAAAARLLYSPETAGDGVTVRGTNLVFTAAKCLRLIGGHAVRAGAYADVAAHMQIVGSNMHLGYLRDGFPHRYDSELALSEAHSRHTIPLSALTAGAQGAFTAVRLMLGDIFNAFGRAEVPHIADDGALRLPYFQDPEFAQWAQTHGVPTTSERLPD